jgi:hypothetical protein
VSCSAWRGCHSQGKTLAEAIANTREAIREYPQRRNLFRMLEQRSDGVLEYWGNTPSLRGPATNSVALYSSQRLIAQARTCRRTAAVALAAATTWIGWLGEYQYFSGGPSNSIPCSSHTLFGICRPADTSLPTLLMWRKKASILPAG